MAVVTYNAGADLIMERALSTTALDLRACHIQSATGATAIATIINQDLDNVAALEALTDISIHANRVALTSETSTEDDPNNRANVDAADVVFPAAAGITAWGWAIYDEGSATDATRILIYAQSFATGQPVDGGLTVQVADFLRVLTATA